VTGEICSQESEVEEGQGRLIDLDLQLLPHESLFCHNGSTRQDVQDKTRHDRRAKEANSKGGKEGRKRERMCVKDMYNGVVVCVCVCVWMCGCV
jgi:hypothetical protein